jgi:hypothetical protein
LRRAVDLRRRVGDQQSAVHQPPAQRARRRTDAVARGRRAPLAGKFGEAPADRRRGQVRRGQPLQGRQLTRAGDPLGQHPQIVAVRGLGMRGQPAVRLAYLIEVMGFVAKLDQSKGGAAPVTPTALAAGAEEWNGWSMNELRRLASAENFTTTVLGEILDVLSAQPGQWRNLDELAKATGRDRAEIKGIWTHVGRHMGKAYPDNGWPLESKWGTEIDPQWAAAQYYMVPEEQAGRWLAVRKPASD